MFLGTVFADIGQQFDAIVHTFNESRELFYPQISEVQNSQELKYMTKKLRRKSKCYELLENVMYKKYAQMRTGKTQSLG